MKSSQIFKIIFLFVFWLFLNSCATSNTLIQSQPPDILPRAVKISVIQNISFIEEENYTRIQIEGSETLEPPFYKLLSAPLGLVIDVPNIDLKQMKEPIKIDNGTVAKVLTTQYDHKGRIEIGLTQVTNYNIFREDKNLIIDIEKVKKIAEVGEEVRKEEEAIKEREIELIPPELKKEEAPPVQRVETAAATETRPKAKKIINFLFDQKKDSIAFNIVGDGRIGSYDAFKLDSPPRLVLDIWEVDTRYRKNLIKIQNPFIKQVRIGRYPDKLRLVFECLTPQLPFYQINRVDDKLIISFGNIPTPLEPQIPLKEERGLLIDLEKPKKVEAKIEAVPEPRREEVAVETKKEGVKKEEEKPAPQPQVTKKVEEEKKVVEEVPSGRIYTGRRLSLDFKDADIKNILRLIAEVSNLNIIAGDDVTGKITMRLVDVPWDQALDIILQARSLGMTKVGNVIRIAPIDKLKKEVEEELTAKRAKEKLEDLMTELIPVNYATAKELLTQVKSTLSDRGDVKVDDRTNTLIVKDIPKNIVGVKNLIKFLDRKTPQVLIEARIIEANLTFQNELGVAWGFLTKTGTDKNKTTTVGGGIPGSSTVSPGTSTHNVVSLPAVSQGGILEFLFSSQYGLKQLDLAISAHENKGNVKIISSPKIATLNNKEASIEQGLRIPYRKLTTEGTITTDFIDANLKLIVTPHVTNDGNIKMIVKAKKDAPDRSIEVDGVPSIDKKEAITEVMVKDNGVVVIAGVYSIEKNFTAEGVPLFNKIPVLGWLFKKESKQDTRKDLLIFISPKIIKDEV